MSKISEFWNTLKERWQHRMPLFFKRICWLGMTMSGTAIAVQEALMHYNIEPDGWWTIAYKYLIGVGVGLATCAKLTQEYTNAVPKDYDKEQHLED